MSTTLTWQDISLRLLLAFVAGACIGFNRGEHGRPAGLRTTLLVCLAACISMLQANLLLGTVGKRYDSFVNFDVMRLPLGILTGVGFIGGGAILRRDNLVLGVTTAATLWFVTVMGLCFGSGQIGLGIAAWAMGMIVLAGLKEIEKRCKEDRRATMTLLTTAEGPNERQLSDNLQSHGFTIASCAVVYAEERNRELTCELRWRSKRQDNLPPAFLKELAEKPGVLKLAWEPNLGR
ncbi:MAG TPA: MgtC/SapB family protein [Pirellulales bacterium]|jgi:putative Mg2+ transporter-C (MgtC) family protein